MSGRILSQVDMAEILDVSTVTLREWTRQGCPVKEAGSKGKAAKYASADVIKWREEQAAGSAYDDDKTKITADEANRRKTLAEARLAELKLAEARGALIDIETVGLAIDSVLGKCRVRLLAMPGALAQALSNEPDPAVIRDKVFNEVSEALNELSGGDLENDISFAGSVEDLETTELSTTTENESSGVGRRTS